MTRMEFFSISHTILSVQTVSYCFGNMLVGLNRGADMRANSLGLLTVGVSAFALTDR